MKEYTTAIEVGERSSLHPEVVSVDVKTNQRDLADHLVSQVSSDLNWLTSRENWDAFEEGDWFDYPLEHDFGWWDGEAFRATEPDMLDDPKENAIRIVSCTGGPHSEIIVTDDDRVFVKGYWGTTSVSLGPVHADGIHYSTLEMFS